MSDATNLYQAPEADITPEPTPTELTLQSPRNCGFGAGWRWFTQGYSLLGKGIGVSVGITLVYLLLMFVLGLIPIINLVSYLLGPVFFAGFMIAAHRAYTEQTIQFSDLFAGFSKNLGSLIIVSLLYLLGMLVSFAIAGIIAAIVFGGGFFEALSSGNAEPTALATSFALFGLVGMAFVIPVLMALWFAPALVVLHDKGPVSAMKLSFSGCLKNVLPFLLFGFVVFFVMAISAIPVGLGLLFTLPAGFYSTYAAYRDIFIDHE